MNYKRGAAIWLAVLLFLSGCTHAEPIEGGATTSPPTTASTTAATKKTVTVKGEWEGVFPVSSLLRLAKDYPRTLALLGEENVSKLATVSPFVSDLKTEAVLALSVSWADEEGTLSIPKTSLEAAATALIMDYNPLLKNVLTPLIFPQLPSAIDVPLWYDLQEEALTAKRAEDPSTAVCCRVAGDDLLFLDVVSTTLTEEECKAFLSFLQEGTLTRKNPPENRAIR